tara:strand:- start:213 stop:452 length:240 start_codon:yes stop_codon:yes gene_type:complete
MEVKSMRGDLEGVLHVAQNINRTFEGLTNVSFKAIISDTGEVVKITQNHRGTTLSVKPHIDTEQYQQQLTREARRAGVI